MRCKPYCFQLVLRDAALVRSLVKEKCSHGVYDRCQSSIVSNLDMYYFFRDNRGLRSGTGFETRLCELKPTQHSEESIQLYSY